MTHRWYYAVTSTGGDPYIIGNGPTRAAAEAQAAAKFGASNDIYIQTERVNLRILTTTEARRIFGDNLYTGEEEA